MRLGGLKDLHTAKGSTQCAKKLPHSVSIGGAIAPLAPLFCCPCTALLCIFRTCELGIKNSECELDLMSYSAIILEKAKKKGHLQNEGMKYFNCSDTH